MNELFPVSMDPAIVARIGERLDGVRRDHCVAIPLAVESGGRAWGFPSPDSDYDARFIFIRQAERYLSPWPSRDVIETPLDEIYDVNGWDLGKALILLLKGNAVVIEWLMSPISYRRDAAFADEMLDLARRVADRGRILHHYLHLGERQRRTYFGDGKAVARKKIFYALRPAAALRWLRQRPEAVVAPMNFPELMEECDPPPGVFDLARRLLADKALSSEMGSAPLPESLAAFIDGEFEWTRQHVKPPSAAPEREARELAEAFFFKALRRYGAGSDD